MEVKWTNVLCFALAIFVLIMAIRMRNRISVFLCCIAEVGPGHTTEEKLWGMMAFGLLAALTLGIIRILTERDRRR